MMLCQPHPRLSSNSFERLNFSTKDLFPRISSAQSAPNITVNLNISNNNAATYRSQGSGVFTWTNGARYDGGFMDNKRDGQGTQLWHDGSSYTGDYSNDLRHGNGKHTWPNGDLSMETLNSDDKSYQGHFFNDRCHGNGTYSWSDGPSYVGPFYMDKRQGYGIYRHGNGDVFEGLYKDEQRYGPGILTYSNGRQDAGLWCGEKLIKICSLIPGAFTLNDHEEYSFDPDEHEKYIDVKLENENVTNFMSFVKSEGIFNYLPEKAVVSKILQFFNNDDNLDCNSYAVNRDVFDEVYYKKEKGDGEKSVSPTRIVAWNHTPMLIEMQRYLYNHRHRQKLVSFDVEQILSGDRSECSFAKGSLELSSEELLLASGAGDLKAVEELLDTGCVHADVADSCGHTALIGASVNWHTDIINCLLNHGANVNQLNNEGISALGACCLFYYPSDAFQYNTVDQRGAISSIFQIAKERRHLTDGLPPGHRRLSNVITGQIPKRENVFLSSEDRSKSGTTKSSVKSPTFAIKPVIKSYPQIPAKSYPASGSKTSIDSGFLYTDTSVSYSSAGRRKTRSIQPRKVESGVRSLDNSDEVGSMTSEDARLAAIKRQFLSDNKKSMITNDYDSAMQDDVEEKEKDLYHIDDEDDEYDPFSIESPNEHTEEEHIESAIRRKSVTVEEQEPVELEEFDSKMSVWNFPITVTDDLIERCATQLSMNERVISVCGYSRSVCESEGTARILAVHKAGRKQMKTTVHLLLARGADPNVCSMPMPTLFFALRAVDVIMVKMLLSKGAIASKCLSEEKSGLSPLHIAVGIPGDEAFVITELLLAANADPNARATEDDSYLNVTMRDEWKNDPIDESVKPLLGGRTPLHIACCHDTNYKAAAKVVRLLLAHKANPNLICNGFNPLALAVASGNDMAVDELLAGGANPSLPLTHGVGNVLCAAGSLLYDHRRTTAAKMELFDKLIAAGADIIQFVPIGPKRQLGTAVDYCYHIFNQDRRIASMPFHALSYQERETFNARRMILGYVGDKLRESATERERQRLEEEIRLERLSESPSACFLYTGSGAKLPAGFKHGKSTAFTVDSVHNLGGSLSNQMIIQNSGDTVPIRSARRKKNIRKPLFRYCYDCGRSLGIRLYACTRCKEVYFCSKACKLRAWTERHKTECIRLVETRGRGQQTSIFEPLSPSHTSLEQTISSVSLRRTDKVKSKIFKAAKKRPEHKTNKKPLPVKATQHKSDLPNITKKENDNNSNMDNYSFE